MQNDETTPKYVRYGELMQEMKNIETKRIPKVHANRPVYDKLSSNLEQKVNDIQLS